MLLNKIIGTVLSVALLSGCATQKVSFTSFPTGVDVIAGEKRGVTPCTLRVHEDLTHATFILPSGETQILPMPEMDSDMQEAGEGLAWATGGILMVAGGIVGIAGAGLFFLGSASLDDDSDWYGGDSDSDDNSDEYAAMGIGLAGMAVGVGVILVGKGIYPDDDTPVLHAEFNLYEEGKPVEGEDRYEDVGFGARRLKKATP
ncbi:hypothetical protein P4C99_18405 [Pontiellaceae bacterium B1224]|nr:hypothetical protein [Pontiellaceae bacterium B1224]